MFILFAVAMKKQEIKGLTEKTARLYEIAVLAVADLGGASRFVDTEDVAIRCHELAASLFSWRKHPRQVNLEIVRVSLSDAKKQKNGRLLSGSGRDGWRLTRSGLDWVSSGSGSKQMATRGAVTRRTAGSIDTVRLARGISWIESSAAWKSWKAAGNVSPEDARSLFRIDSYASDQLIDIKITRLLSAFDPETEHRKFLEAAGNSIRDIGANDA